MPGGRPSKLTPAVIKEFEKYLPTALYIDTVGDYLGISRITWRVWLRRGRREADRLAKDPKAKPKRSEALYLEFFYMYQKGVSEGQMFAIGVIRGAASKRPSVTRTITTTDPDGVQTVTEETKYFQPQWTAAAWLAERRFNSKWGMDRSTIRELQKIIVDLEAKVQHLVSVVQEAPTAGEAPAK